MLNIILNDWFPIVKSLIINQIHQHNIQMQHNKTPHTNILRIHFINLHVFFQIRLIQSHKRENILFILDDNDDKVQSLSVISLIKKIIRYNQNQNVYQNINIINKTRNTRTGILINSANQAHTQSNIGLYFLFLVFSFLDTVSISMTSSEKISSGSHIEFTIFTNCFCVISHFSSNNFSSILCLISSIKSSEILWASAYFSILEIYFSKKSFAEFSILKDCHWNLKLLIVNKLLNKFTL